DQTTASGADGGANGHLLLSRNAASQLQVGNIRAHDQHHHCDRSRQNEETIAQVAGHMLVQRNKYRAERVALRVLLLDLFRKNFKLGACGLECYSWFQATDHGQCVSPTVGFLSQWHRKIYVNWIARREHRSKIESARRDSYDCDGCIVESDRATDDIRVGGETPLPRIVTQ